MKNIDNLVKYIDLIQTDNTGEWVLDKEDDGTPSQPMQIPYVNYSEEVENFISDFYSFVSSSPEIDLSNYQKIIVENGLSWNIETLMTADVSKLDKEAILALIMGIIRSDRFSEGTILRVLQSGALTRWLERLKQLEQKY